MINWLERRFGNFAIQNFTLILIFGQIVIFIGVQTGHIEPSRVVLIGAKVLEGEWWRIVTFLFIPISNSILWSIFAWMLYYSYGTALEDQWGTFKYNFYVFLSFLFFIGVSFAYPFEPLTNVYLFSSIMLAFAYLYPDYTLHLFFILPVKIKWIAWLTWAFYTYQALVGTWGTRLTILAAVSNFLVFFGKELFLSGKRNFKYASKQPQKWKSKNEAFHQCQACEKNDVNSPESNFRYCTECGGKCYCEDHIHDHVCKV